ncbi:hypothetical protein [Metabacillus idriensis]|uniref:hypothetical protein n=1 Tax=Metabacillus idriensis TaxID=324768 RepID=UPI00174C3F71|nr:hypothetical protein [Metabacillus idriensis]
MVSTLTKLKLKNFLKNDIAKKVLNNIRDEIRVEEKLEEIGDSGSLEHSLSTQQLNRLNDRLSSRKALTVGQYLRKLTSERGIYKFNSTAFGEAYIYKEYWSDLLNDKIPTYDKDKLIRVAITLKLNLKETMKLLYKAGFTLSEENKKDEVIIFCLEEDVYDLDGINDILVDNGLPTIFSKIRSLKS